MVANLFWPGPGDVVAVATGVPGAKGKDDDYGKNDDENSAEDVEHVKDAEQTALKCVAVRAAVGSEEQQKRGNLPMRDE
jgi:hypothetical protein